jgi:transposase
MKFYTQQHRYYCGIDLHARSMFICILDQSGKVLVHQNLKTREDLFLELIEPYRDDLVVAVECIFTWYWIADLCAREGISFVLGHALYMKAIHGVKTKNDKIDSQKIAAMLRGGLLPQAYVYPSRMRSTRDLMRRRLHFVRKRAELLSHIENTNHQYLLPEFSAKLRYKKNRPGVAERFLDPSVQKSIEVDLQLIEHYDLLIRDLELHITRAAKHHDPHTLLRLKTIHGVGKILALTLLYEIHDIQRFPRVQDFVSYARLIRCTKESVGRRTGSGGKKIGNAHLKWAFSEATLLFLRKNPAGQHYLQRLQRKHGKGKALSILAHKLARATYYMLTRHTAFDMNTFIRS